MPRVHAPDCPLVNATHASNPSRSRTLDLSCVFTDSVKCVLHWFQMMYSGRLSMFADGPASQYVPVTYDVARVSCPVAIVYGGRDVLGKRPPPRPPSRDSIETTKQECR